MPALVLLGGLSMPAAIGTSLAVIALKSGSALVGYLAAVDLDVPLTLAVTGATVAGSLAGARIVDHVPGHRLRRTFGWAVLVAGAAMLLAEAPATVQRSPATWVATAVAGGLLVWWIRRPAGAATSADPAEEEGASART